jgi:hypothetical protein
VLDEATQTTTVIRPDDAQYEILWNGTRKIQIDSEFAITQACDDIAVSVPGYPVVHASADRLSFKLGGFTFTFDGLSLLWQCDEYQAKFADGKCEFAMGKAQAVLTIKRCEIREDSQVLIATSEGIESMGTIYVVTNAKKKVETIETSFGKIVTNKEVSAEPVLLTRHRMFPPRFFAIRSDFSAVEFLRKDVLPEMVEKIVKVEHPSQPSLELMTRHLPNTAPFVYVHHESLSKPARSAVLKELHIPKGKGAKLAKGAVAHQPPPAPESIGAYVEQCSTFLEAMNEALIRNEEQYQEDIKPPVPPPPEIIRPPVQTPVPRLQMMQYDHCQGGVASDINYWLCHESDFAYPLFEPKIPAKSLASRRALHDPPRVAGTEEPPFDEEQPEDYTGEAAFMTQPTVSLMISSPSMIGFSTLKMEPENEVAFGTIFAGRQSVNFLKLANTGTQPFHFHFTQNPEDGIWIEPLSGVVFPGLKLRVKVTMDPPATIDREQKFRSGFVMKTGCFDRRIAVSASLVPAPVTPKAVASRPPNETVEPRTDNPPRWHE